MAEIEITSPVMTEEAGQAIASAISTMSSTSVGNLSALTTTDKTSLVGAVNEVKSGLTNGVVDTTSVQDVRFVKIGRIVTMVTEVWHQGFTVPVGFRPWTVTYLPARVSAGGGTTATIGYIRIGTDGVLTIPDNTDFVGTVTWVTE